MFETQETGSSLRSTFRSGKISTSAAIDIHPRAVQSQMMNDSASNLDGFSVPRTVTPPLSLPYNMVLKHLLEMPVALLSFVAVLPLMVFIALAVKLTSRGPLLHRRRVTGRGGTQFDAYKFRTMVPEAEDWMRRDPALQKEFAAKYKLACDPRVTPIGRALRKLSLDELPQLVNVLKGQMCLVGPRMISPEELTKYGPFAQKLVTVKPGLTGLWQVSGRQTTTYDRRVELDMYYIDNWSLALDLAIMVRTPLVVLCGKGAL